MRLGLQIKAQLENIGDLRPEGEEFRWYLKVSCANCGEVSKWIYATLTEHVPLKGGRGKASLVLKCKMCLRENSLDIVADSVQSYTSADSGNFKTIVSFECRGLDVVDFDPRGGFAVTGEESRSHFTDIGLSDKEWYDYDEHKQQPVSITELEHRFTRV